MFKNDDLMVGTFRRTTPDGRKIFAKADYDDDEILEPDIVEHLCRVLEIDPSSLHIACGDGHVSVQPPVIPTPPPTPPPN